MIGESSNVSTLLNNERVYKNDPVQKEQGESAKAEESREQAVSDTASFSPQALALSRNVIASGESSGEQRTEAQGKQQETRPADGGARFLDIRA